MARIISLDEVKKHRHKDSVWTIIHNDIYDVTSFLEEHPGGEESLLEVAGEDGTQGFEDVGHSDDARELLKKYKIGTLSTEDRAKPISPCCKNTRRKSSQIAPVRSEYKIPTTPRPERRVQSITVPKESSSNLKWALLALGGAIVLGIVLKKYMGSK